MFNIASYHSILLRYHDQDSGRDMFIGRDSECDVSIIAALGTELVPYVCDLLFVIVASQVGCRHIHILYNDITSDTWIRAFSALDYSGYQRIRF